MQTHTHTAHRQSFTYSYTYRIHTTRSGTNGVGLGQPPMKQLRMVFAPRHPQCRSGELFLKLEVATRRTRSGEPSRAYPMTNEEKLRSCLYRECKTCKKNLILTEFFDINFHGANGRKFRKHVCKSCRSTLALQRRQIKKMIRIEDHFGKPCPICTNTLTKNGYRRAVIDHDHNTGLLRGVLCNNCNTGLGKLGDSKMGLLRAMSYLATGGAVL